MKKLLFLSLMVLTTLVIAACGSQDVTVTFDSQGGSNVAAVTLSAGETVAEPAAPTYPEEEDVARSFVGWFTNASATTAYDFASPVEEDLTLYAGWTENLVVSFNTKTSQSMDPVLLDVEGGTLSAPTPPTREGYRFGGWFMGLAGMTWLEPNAVEFPLEVSESMTLNAYWEPLDSAAVNYAKNQTYISSLSSDFPLILNPFTYQYSTEDAIMGNLSTDLYGSQVDWAKAIEQGVADYIGDFSKIEAREFSVDALDFYYIKIGAARFPVDSEGEEHLTEDGLYNREAAATILDDEWTFHIRDDLYFVDGYHITAQTYEYALRQYLDPIQLNSRSNIYYKTESNQNGYPIVNALEYFSGEVLFSEVGFEIIDDYTFKITTTEEINQNTARAMGDIQLVHPEVYEASLTQDRGNSTYGTPVNPFVSYGPYLMKSWDENQRVVLNKNYEYIKRETINYKSIVYEIIDTIDQRYQLFEQGDLSVVGLTQEYAAEYAEWPNSYYEWDGYPQYILMNTRASMLDTEDAHQVPSIMFDEDFRRALFLGLDRNFYASSVYAPNVASLLIVPNDTKQYLQDALYFSESPQFLSVLEEFDIDPESGGYYPNRAVELFNAAYDRWVAEGNSGPVELVMTVLENETNERITSYVESSYEDLFGADKINIVRDINPSAAHNQKMRDLEFDISLAAIGFGSSTDVLFQTLIIGFAAGIFYGPEGGYSFGFTNPYEGPDRALAEYYTEPITADLSNTYQYLLSFEEDELSDASLELLGLLQEETDENGNVVKAAGILNASVQEFQGILLGSAPWDATASEPYPGATVDTYNLTAAMTRAMLDYVNFIPTVTRASVALYGESVEITWPAYSVTFGWGANRYRYINTDPDFAEGMYNVYADAE